MMRFVVVALLLLLALGALAGGASLMLGPRGEIMHMPLGLLEGTPFATFFVPGLLLFTFLGVLPLVAAVAALRRSPLAWWLLLASAAATLGWITGQLLLLGYISWLQPFYLAYGLVLLGLAWVPGVRRGLGG